MKIKKCQAYRKKGKMVTVLLKTIEELIIVRDMLVSDTFS